MILELGRHQKAVVTSMLSSPPQTSNYFVLRSLDRPGGPYPRSLVVMRYLGFYNRSTERLAIADEPSN
jgi:hypothetical protein